jgi:hypothetical protein
VSIMGNMTGKYWRSRDNWMQFSKVLVGITVYFFQCFFFFASYRRKWRESKVSCTTTRFDVADMADLVFLVFKIGK